jgi:nicotinate phosphoribosyltransferase
VLAFESELESYRELQKLLGEATIYLVDSYDTLEGTRQAASLGGPMWGVRLDSGNLVELSRAVRRILDEAGLPDARIMVTGDLNEYKILELMKENLPIDAFGVGTELATSADDPKLGVVYKLVELESEGERRFPAKFSEDKHTWPGAKQVFRYPGHDLVSGAWEPAPTSEPSPKALLETVVSEGQLEAELPSASEARERATEGLKQLRSAYRSLFAIDPPYPVERSAELRALLERTRRQIQGD